MIHEIDYLFDPPTVRTIEGRFRRADAGPNTRARIAGGGKIVRQRACSPTKGLSRMQNRAKLFGIANRYQRVGRHIRRKADNALTSSSQPMWFVVTGVPSLNVRRENDVVSAAAHHPCGPTGKRLPS